MLDKPDFIELPVPGPDDPPVTYAYFAGQRCPHRFTWNPGTLELSDAELAAIPMVKALANAASRLLDICHFLTPSIIYKYLGDDAAVAAGLPLWPERYSGDPSMQLDLSWAEAAAVPFKGADDGPSG